MIKRFLRRTLERGLTHTGISGRTAGDLLVTLGRYKIRLGFLLLTSIVAPLIELVFIGLLYVMVASDGQARVASQIARMGLTPFYARIGGTEHYWALVIGTAILSLMLLMASRLLEHWYLNLIKYDLDVTYMHRVIDAYLEAPPAVVLRLDRHRVSSAVLTEAVGYGVFAYDLLLVASLVTSVSLFLGTAVLVSVPLLLISSALALCTVVVARRAYRKAREISTRRVALQSQLVARLFDVIEGFRVAKIEGAERRLSGRMRDFFFSSQRWRLDKGRNQMSVTVASEGLLYAALLLIISLSLLVFRIDSTVILVFLVLMGRLQKYIAALQQHWLQLRSGAPSLEAVQHVIATCRPVAAPARPRVASVSPTRIRLEEVTFAYPGDDGLARPVVKDLTLDLRAGDRILIQGKSGQGKSTLLHLLSGLLTPTSGRALYDDEPLDDNTFERAREHVAYAAPDLHVFRDSVRDNLSLARDYAVEEIDRAIGLARLTDVVSQITGGLDGFIGENGSQLSLGERQRVMLARLFLKRAKVILLDEATTNLDQKLENEILTSVMDELGPDGILVVVTHRRPPGIAFTKEYFLLNGRLTLVSSAATPTAAGHS